MIETPTPPVVLYQPFEPSGEAGSRVMVVTGGSSEASYAPMSSPAPCGRAIPRWSSGSAVAASATSAAGLVTRIFIVGVRPGALSASGPRPGSSLVSTPGQGASSWLFVLLSVIRLPMPSDVAPFRR